MILAELGGIYLDTDQILHYYPTIFNYMMDFYTTGMLDGLQLQSTLLASHPLHSIVVNALETMTMFIEHPELGPDYISSPCWRLSKMFALFETGPGLVSIEYFKHANENGNVDIILPGPFAGDTFDQGYRNGSSWEMTLDSGEQLSFKTFSKHFQAESWFSRSEEALIISFSDQNQSE